MGWAGFGHTQLRYDMFDLECSIEDAARLRKCERIYHHSLHEAWAGKDVLDQLLIKHGGVSLPDEKKQALERVFAIILWGELAAWKISSQLADSLIPLEAKLAATGQAIDEARHFHVMHQYLLALGYSPAKLDRAPQALLDMVLETPTIAHKLLGMQLMIEPLALNLFQTIRELEVEPVLTELLPYFERDEARHVALGVQYLPQLIAKMSVREQRRMLAFQGKLLALAVLELKSLEPDLKLLGVDVRKMVERGRRRQLGALRETYAALGKPLRRGALTAVVMATSELLFPVEWRRRRPRARLAAAWRKLWEISTGEHGANGENKAA